MSALYCVLHCVLFQSLFSEFNILSFNIQSTNCMLMYFAFRNVVFVCLQNDLAFAVCGWVGTFFIFKVISYVNFIQCALL